MVNVELVSFFTKHQINPIINKLTLWRYSPHNHSYNAIFMPIAMNEYQG